MYSTADEARTRSRSAKRVTRPLRGLVQFLAETLELLQSPNALLHRAAERCVDQGDVDIAFVDLDDCVQRVHGFSFHDTPIGTGLLACRCVRSAIGTTGHP